MEQYDVMEFKQELEQALGSPLSGKSLQGTYLLLAEQQQATIAIYLPGCTERLKLATDRSIHIDLDQLQRDRTKIIKRLQALLGSGKTHYARQTVVARLDKRVALAFQEEHHLQVALAGKYRYGLYHQGELVSIAVFSGGRHMREEAPNYRSFELLRFCHKGNLRVVGGLSKLIKAFRQDFNPQDIMTYVDRDWAQHSNLTTLGFKEQGHTAPQYFWVVGLQRHYLRSEAELADWQQREPEGYCCKNQGSTKLIWKITAPYA